LELEQLTKTEQAEMYAGEKVVTLTSVLPVPCARDVEQQQHIHISTN
jgi:hypothetical protein